MTTHVFIVDSQTFKIHLEHMFVGTGSKENSIDFLLPDYSGSNVGSNTEKTLVGMSADACRIRKNDNIIFYLQQNSKKGINEGKFYGLFRVISNESFLDDNDGSQYLMSELGKSLTFRALIEPDTVYPEGVTEWEALDDITSFSAPHQMLWSLIYRKLRGLRGNTMITIYESERLCQLIRNKNIRNKNKRQTLSSNGHKLSFDILSEKIIVTTDAVQSYSGRQDDIDVLPLLVDQIQNKKAREVYLQSYIVKNIGRSHNISLDNAVLPSNSSIEWIGNEVSCGVGMQRIDIALSVVIAGSQKKIIPIELKTVNASIDNVRQISRYIDWIEQYYIPNRQSNISPILITKKHLQKGSKRYQDILASFRQFNNQHQNRCNALKYIEFELNNGQIEFTKVDYQ